MSFLVYVIVFLYLSNYFQIHAFLSQIGKKKVNNKIENHSFSKSLKDKRGLKIDEFFIFESKKPFALMPSFFNKPEIIISSKMYNTFNRGEMEWIMMHEATHYLKKHNLKAAGLQIIYGLVGLSAVYYYSLSELSSLIVAALLSILFAQTNRRIIEKEADQVAAKFCNPKDMISGAEKLKSYYFRKNNRFIFVKKILGWNISLEERISIALKASKTF